MKTRALQSWREVQDEIILRIQRGAWQAGELIPKEIDLAAEFNCARATVNRALRELAEQGLLERRRKGGTRVIAQPVRKAKLDVPLIRHEIENLGATCSHTILYRKTLSVPSQLKDLLKISDNCRVLQLHTLYFSDTKPFVYEKRWINLKTVPQILDADLTQTSANEWLIDNIPLSTGNFTFSAKNASAKEAAHLQVDEGVALFVVDRTTWINKQSITHAHLCYAPGFAIKTSL